MIIETKQNKSGNWWCYATVNGYDKSFEGYSIEDAQSKMRKFLKEKGIQNAIFKSPVYYVVDHLKNRLNGNRPYFKVPMIDKSPFA